MSVRFEREYFLRTSDFDCYGRLRPSGIMDLFQDVAGAHAEELGCGFAEFAQKDMLWVLVRLKFEILSQPEVSSCVRVKTWPLAPTRAGFRREYFIEDINGKLLVKGASDWVIMHRELRKLMPAKDVYSIKEGFITEQAFPERLSKIHDFECENEGFKISTNFSDLDRNMHVNNIKYMDFVLNALNPAETDSIRAVQIDYRKEVLAGTTLAVQTKREGNSVLAKGIDQNGDVMFLCQIKMN